MSHVSGAATLQEVDACTALALDPDFAEAYYWRAMARCESGYIIGAAADMRTCLEKLQGEDLKRVAQQVSLDKPDCALPGPFLLEMFILLDELLA